MTHEFAGKRPGAIIHSKMPLPPVITESLPLSLQDAYEITPPPEGDRPGHWVTIATLGAELDLPALEAQLRMLLPDHGITVQKDATV